MTKARTLADNFAADINGITAGTGITGGGTSGTVTVTNSMATAIDAAGDLIYGTGSDAFTRLGIGTAGQVLQVNSGATAPEWATAASGSFTLIATASPSAASTFEFTSIPGTYKKLYLVGSLVPSADGNGQNYLEFNSDTGSLYRKTAFGFAGAASQALEASNQMQLHNSMDNVKGFSIVQHYHNYTQTNIKIMTQHLVGWQYDNSAQINTFYQNTNFMYAGTSAISAIKFYAVTGTYTGTVLLYGQN